MQILHFPFLANSPIFDYHQIFYKQIGWWIFAHSQKKKNRNNEYVLGKYCVPSYLIVVNTFDGGASCAPRSLFTCVWVVWWWEWRFIEGCWTLSKIFWTLNIFNLNFFNFNKKIYYFCMINFKEILRQYFIFKYTGFVQIKLSVTFHYFGSI